MSEMTKWIVANAGTEIGSRTWPSVEKAIFNGTGTHLHRVTGDEIVSVALADMVDDANPRDAIVELYKRDVIRIAQNEALEQARIVGVLFRNDPEYRPTVGEMKKTSSDLACVVYFNAVERTTERLVDEFSMELEVRFRDAIEAPSDDAELEAPVRAFG